MSHIFIYSTFPTIEKAKSISKTLVEEKLVACANILPQMESIYLWEGKVNQDKEVVVIYKTTKKNFNKVEEKILALHPHEIPCVVSIDLNQGYDKFLEWISHHVTSS